MLFLSTGCPIPGVTYDSVPGLYVCETEKSSTADFQTCLPVGTHTMTIVWRMYSEEFKAYCGSSFQDSLLAELRDAGGTATTLLERSIDDLCPSEECAVCGDHYEGLEQSELFLDQGGTWNTPWITTVVPLEIAEQEHLTLHLEVNDGVDSIYDTVFLIDRISFTDYVPCTPSCAGKECGSDGCFGTCGLCPEGQWCEDFECLEI